MNILSHLLVAATIVLSSTAGAAEHQGNKLGEFVEAGEHGGRPYYRQRDTEGNRENFLYRRGGEWVVSDTLGKSVGAGLKNPLSFFSFLQTGFKPPADEWLYYDGKKWNNNDTSLTLEFTSLSPCQLVRVEGEGDVVEKQGSRLGDYRSALIQSL